MSVLLGLVFVLIIVMGYKYRRLFSLFHYYGMYRSALHRLEQPAQQQPVKKQCPRCNRELEQGHVLIRYPPLDQNLSFLLQRFDPFRMATGSVASMMSAHAFQFAPNATLRRGYRCPSCGIFGIES